MHINIYIHTHAVRMEPSDLWFSQPETQGNSSRRITYDIAHQCVRLYQAEPSSPRWNILHLPCSEMEPSHSVSKSCEQRSIGTFEAVMSIVTVPFSFVLYLCIRWINTLLYHIISCHEYCRCKCYWNVLHIGMCDASHCYFPFSSIFHSRYNANAYPPCIKK